MIPSSSKFHSPFSVLAKNIRSICCCNQLFSAEIPHAALTTVNLAKMHWLDTRKLDAEPFSMVNFKTMCHNMLLLERFICVFATNPNLAKNQYKIKELYQYGLIAV